MVHCICPDMAFRHLKILTIGNEKHYSKAVEFNTNWTSKLNFEESKNKTFKNKSIDIAYYK